MLGNLQAHELFQARATLKRFRAELGRARDDGRS
jgi:hypothetical protein